MKRAAALYACIQSGSSACKMFNLGSNSPNTEAQP